MIDPREHNSYIKMIDPFVWAQQKGTTLTSIVNPLTPSRSTNFNLSKTTTNLLQVLSTIFSRRREPPRPFTKFKVHLISTVDRKRHGNKVSLPDLHLHRFHVKESQGNGSCSGHERREGSLFGCSFSSKRKKVNRLLKKMAKSRQQQKRGRKKKKKKGG